jgi:hypothetical protein
VLEALQEEDLFDDMQDADSEASERSKQFPHWLITHLPILLCRAHDHDPAVVEARALQAVEHTKKAAKALQYTRAAIVRLQELGNTAGVAAALKAEAQAKRAFIRARETSAPLVAEARSNYEANQGTEIQAVAKQVAQDTWRSMTGVPLARNPLDAAAPSRIASEGVGAREAAIRHATYQVAGDYVTQARQARTAAIDAQRRLDGTISGGRELPASRDRLAPIRGNPAVSQIARYAQQARNAMQATKAAQASVEAHMAALKKQREALEASKTNQTIVANHTSAMDEASGVIANAEQNVAESMRTVEAAAMKRGMTDNTWRSRIGGLLKNGQPAEADQAAQDYVQQRINHVAASVVHHSTIDAAVDQIQNAQQQIDAAAKKHAALNTKETSPTKTT